MAVFFVKNLLIQTASQASETLIANLVVSMTHLGRESLSVNGLPLVVDLRGVFFIAN